MFVLDLNQKFKWNELFLVISLDRFTPFMTDIGFPLPNQLSDVQKISRNFVEKFFEIQQKVNSQDINDRYKELFRNTLNELTAIVGEENTNTFVEWGNKFETGSRGHSISRFWDNKILRKIIKSRDYDNDTIVDDFSVYKFYTLLIRCEQYLDGVFNTIDAVETMPKTNWDSKAYKIYHLAANREYEVEGLYHSPLIALSSFIIYIKVVNLLFDITRHKQINKLLNELQLSDEQKSNILSIVQEE